MDPRLARRRPENSRRASGLRALQPNGGISDAHGSDFREDLERIRFSPYFSRLAAVTQVISQGAAGQVVHNRLTHTVKVTAVARAIAVALRSGPDLEVLDRLGGCDHVVVQAAASAHDLGHPPFGHLGERILDRIARSRFGLADGFEGNAQSFRILTALAVHGDSDDGLNLTAAVRAAVLKYPWLRTGFPVPHPSAAKIAPRGAGTVDDAPGAAKFSTYVLDAAEMIEVRSAYPQIGAWQQTPECSVMDIADDIAYSLHDLDDFHRAGVLQHALVAAEFRTWTRRRATLERTDLAELRSTDRRPGHSLELLRRRLHVKDDWIVDDEVFAVAVGRVGTDLVDGLLAVPFDSSIAAERAIGMFTASWIEHLENEVTVQADPPVRSGHVGLRRQAWHEVAVLKFVHQRFVLDRPDLAMFQRGQAQLLLGLVAGLDSWLADPADGARAPRRLVDLVSLATQGYQEVAGQHPELLVGPTGEQVTSQDDLARMGRGRGIIDYVASLTDDQATSAAATLAGSVGHFFQSGGGL